MLQFKPPPPPPQSPLPYDLSCAFSFPSLVRSPVESFAGSSETESEDEDCGDYVAQLAAQIAHSKLDDDDDEDENSREDYRSLSCASEHVDPTQSSLSASPHSTLVGVGCCSSECSNSCSALSSSKALNPSEAECDSWDLLYPATGEVVQLKMCDERRASSTTVLSARASLKRILQQPAVTLSNTVHFGGSEKDLSQSSVSTTEPKCASYCGGKTQPSNLQGSSAGARARNNERGAVASRHLRASKHGGTSWGGRSSRPLPHHHSGGGSPPGGGRRWELPHRLAWGATDFTSSHQVTSANQQHLPLIGGEGSGMRAIFLGVTGSRESGGTGVFLPRRIGYGRESAKKPDCSTVLLPARVVQAMNINVEDILSKQVSTSTRPLSGRDLWPIQNSSSDECTQSGWCSALQEVTPEISLPTEWTY